LELGRKLKWDRVMEGAFLITIELRLAVKSVALVNMKRPVVKNRAIEQCQRGEDCQQIVEKGPISFPWDS
jgi:hypothetical protein